MLRIVLIALASFSPLVLAQVEIPENAKKIKICPDYNSYTNCQGSQYRIVSKARNTVITRHEGIDFLGAPGTEVISASHGKVFLVEHAECGGGIVAVASEIFDIEEVSQQKKRIGIRYVHINPKVKKGDVVKPGDVIGSIQDPNDPSVNDQCVGMFAHVHFEMLFQYYPVKLHISPHKYWMDGPNKLSCYKNGIEVPTDKIIAPVLCE